jgi:hypothetical protein
MAFTARHNITTAITQDLVTAGDVAGNIHSINLFNVHASSSVGVDLIINNGSDNFYIIKNVTIPAGVGLVVDTSAMKISTSQTLTDSLRIKLSAAVPVDVIINT